MGMFSLSKSHKNWGWLCDEKEPWKILSRDSELNLFSIVSRLAGEEAFPGLELADKDTTMGPVFVHKDVKVGTNVRFEGPVYVESGSEIRHGAYLRPGSYVSNNCVVGHCTEIKNSLMLPYSKAPHFNYVGDSILGHSVNLGAGAKISNVRLDRRSIPIQFSDGNRADSGLRKLGALIGDKSEIGCNVVTNPGSVIPPSSAIPPNTVVTGHWNNRVGSR